MSGPVLVPILGDQLTRDLASLRGRTKEARILAQRAADMLPGGSAGWRRAQDVLNAVKNAKN